MPLDAEGGAGEHLISLHFLKLRLLAPAQSPAGRLASIGFSKSEVAGSTGVTGLNVGMGGKGREICPAKAQKSPRSSWSPFCPPGPLLSPFCIRF